jgi:diguanylate cyclase (GGDEF)-like protein
MLIGTCQDITQRKTLQREVEHRTFHDTLTDLPNRALFLDRLDHALAVARRTGERVALLYLDLDDFKAINDSHGHLIGDMALTAVAERLRACVRPADTLARLGGDEFALLVEGLDGRPPHEIAERLLASLAAPFVFGGRAVSVGASVGMAVGTWTRPDQAVAAADAAMYRAKAAGRGCIEVEVSISAVPA